jgi:hypothetical protein
MKNKKIVTAIQTSVQAINENRPDEKVINLSQSSQLLGEKSVLDSLDLFMFTVELESQLKSVGIDINVMSVIESVISENNEISLSSFVTKLEKL